MLARLHDLDALRGVHLGGRGEDRGVHARPGERLFQLGRVVRDAVLPGHRRGRFGCASDDAHDFGAGNALEAVEVFLGERPVAHHDEFHKPLRSELE